MTDRQLEATLGHFGGIRGPTLEELAELLAADHRDAVAQTPAGQGVTVPRAAVLLTARLPEALTGLSRESDT